VFRAERVQAFLAMAREPHGDGEPRANGALNALPTVPNTTARSSAPLSTIRTSS